LHSAVGPDRRKNHVGGQPKRLSLATVNVDQIDIEGLTRLAGTITVGKDENLVCPGRVRIAAEPLEAYVEGYVINQWRNPEAIKIAQSDDDRMARIREISSEMAQLQEQKNEALWMKLRGEVDLKTYRAVARELDAAHDEAEQGAQESDQRGGHAGAARPIASLG
jgi:hypothetical protein